MCRQIKNTVFLLVIYVSETANTTHFFRAQTQTASRLKRLRPSTDTNQQRQQITGHNHDQEGHTTQNQQQGKTETHTAELNHLKRKNTVNVKQQAEEARNKYKRKKRDYTD